MYSQTGARGDTKGPILDIDVFGIPAAFIHGVLGYEYGSTSLTLHPRLPPGIQLLTQKFPVRWGGAQLFFVLGQPAAVTNTSVVVVSAVLVDGVACTNTAPAAPACITADGEAVVLPWSAMKDGSASTVGITMVLKGNLNPNPTVMEGSRQPFDGLHASSVSAGVSVDAVAVAGSGAGVGAVAGAGVSMLAKWEVAEATRAMFIPTAATPPCAVNETVTGWATNATTFSKKMEASIVFTL
jgi:hypothetical protein